MLVRTVASHAATEVPCAALKSFAPANATSAPIVPSVLAENPDGPRNTTSYMPSEGAR